MPDPKREEPEVDPLDSDLSDSEIEDGAAFGGIAADAVHRIQTAEYETEERRKEQEEAEPDSQIDHKPAKTPLTWKERCQEYYQAAPSFAIAYLQVFCFYLGFLSIYWGSIYKRDTRYQNVKYLVVNEDTEFDYDGNTVQPYLGNAILDMLVNNETLSYLGDFHIVNVTEFGELAASHNNTPYEEVLRQVHHQKFWGGLYVAPNSTELIYDSFYTANATFMTSGAINQTITMVYETGQHFSALSQYIFKNLNYIGEAWLRNYVGREVYGPILSLLNETQRGRLVSSNETLPILTTFPTFTFADQRPSTNPAVLAPSEIQLIYALLVSLYSFNFSVEIYVYMKKKIVYKSFLFYKFLISQLHALLMGLVYALMSKAFRISTSVTFGKSGFLVLWMFVYLFISACGVINEVVMQICIAYDKKELIAPWMVLNIVSNVSSTFAPFVLMPGFYRYGYAMPMYNAYEALKVVFFNTWKGHLGRNIGILVVWIVVGNVVLVFITGWASRRAKRIANEKRSQQAKS
ncbi:Nitrosoguanidine resistance protein SNG1 [Candida viswanathii]|uniref:Nitrosoguanidine resistance protein SNG1 n=1 Tax=Candida viswanathii TaxID=5486 RepID=A0A367YHM3_9ASCO|nr:Nitrosoguanidine resistance protein SNG1 [Candida viswanathii]